MGLLTKILLSSKDYMEGMQTANRYKIYWIAIVCLLALCVIQEVREAQRMREINALKTELAQIKTGTAQARIETVKALNELKTGLNESIPWLQSMVENRIPVQKMAVLAEKLELLAYETEIKVKFGEFKKNTDGRIRNLEAAINRQ